MKVTVERAALLKSVGHVHRVVELRNTIPILANILIRAEKGKLALKATDLDLEVIETIPAEVSPAGSTAVSPNSKPGATPSSRRRNATATSSTAASRTRSTGSATASPRGGSGTRAGSARFRISASRGRNHEPTGRSATPCSPCRRPRPRASW